jgi:hypothetical protein
MSKRILVSVFENSGDVREAVNALIKGGVSKQAISVIGKGNEEAIEDIELEKENADILIWGEQGAFWGALIGLLLGGVFFVVPGFGPIVAAGPVVAALSGMLGGALTGGAALALAAALVEWGIGEAEAKRYEKLVKENKLLLMVHGDEEVVKKAEEILSGQKGIETKIH